MTQTDFSWIATELSRLRHESELLVQQAFGLLRAHRPVLATALLTRHATASQAAHWLAAPQRGLGHRAPWVLLAEGDEDAVWDLIDPTPLLRSSR